MNDSPSLIQQRRVAIRESFAIAERTYRMRLDAPDLARRIRPGQFYMLRVPNRSDPLMARPFALYDTWLDASGEPAGVDLVYLVVGKMTSLMAAMSCGEQVEVWGPLGNGFSMAPSTRLLLVAGGIGQTPFPAVVRAYGRQRFYGSDSADAAATPHEPPRGITLHYGVRTNTLLAGLDDFERLGVRIEIATDDGSAGHAGLVTDLVESALASTDPPDRILGCGPLPMLHALAHLAERYAVSCELSLETPMACGVGICFSCVAPICQEDGSWDYRRVCVDGPVFDSRRVVFC